MKLTRLPANQSDRFYAGVATIRAFRNLPPLDEARPQVPEDCIASATTVFGDSALGLTRLPEGTYLRDAVQADADTWLGPVHVERDQLVRWVDEQDTAALVDALQSVPVAPGDAVLVPAGLPHPTGDGVFLAELQGPTDYSILLEWDGFAIDGRRDGHLGLGFEVALDAVDRSGRSQADVDAQAVR